MSEEKKARVSSLSSDSYKRFHLITVWSRPLILHRNEYEILPYWIDFDTTSSLRLTYFIVAKQLIYKIFFSVVGLDW